MVLNLNDDGAVTPSLDDIVQSLRVLDTQISRFRRTIPLGGKEGSPYEYSTLVEALRRMQLNLHGIYHRSPIMRLSPEILGTILHTVYKLELRSASHCRKRIDLPAPLLQTSYYAGLHLSHVSRHWRDVAASCGVVRASLGVVYEQERKIQNTGPAPPFLDISSRVLLDVYLVADGLDAPYRAVQLASQTQCIRTLEFHGSLSRWDEKLVISYPALHLEALTIARPLPILSEGITSTCPLLFAGQYPNLRSLSLSGVVDCSLNSFQALRQLRLTYLDFRSDRHDMEKLFDLLRSMSSLEDLALERMVLGERCDAALASLREHPIQFKSLRQLAFLELRLLDVIPVLAAFTSCTSRQLAITIDARSADDIHDFVVFMDEYPSMHLFADCAQLEYSYGRHSVLSHLCSVQMIGQGGALQLLNFTMPSNDDRADELGWLVEDVPELWIRRGDETIAPEAPPRDLGSLLGYINGPSSIFIDDDKLVVDDHLYAPSDNFWNDKEKHIHLRLPRKSEDVQQAMRDLDDFFKYLSRVRPRGQNTFHVYPDDPSAEISYALDHWRARFLTEYRNSLHNMRLEVYPAGTFPRFSSKLPEVCTRQSDGEWEWPTWVD